MTSPGARLGLALIVLAGLFAIVSGFINGTTVMTEGTVADVYTAGGGYGRVNNYVKVSTDAGIQTVTVDGVLFGDIEPGMSVTITEEECFYGLFKDVDLTINE